jgi:hypothetical protein
LIITAASEDSGFERQLTPSQAPSLTAHHQRIGQHTKLAPFITEHYMPPLRKWY